MKLEDLRIYQLSMELGEKVWQIVAEWKYFEKDTIGKQLIRSTDSISANISEGFGRFHYQDSKRFYYIARGSLSETKTWLTKSYNRNLISEIAYNDFNSGLQDISVKLNNYIKTIGKTNNE